MSQAPSNRWFVTGGAGFIGSHFMDFIDEPTVNFDLLTYAAWCYEPDSRLIQGDICNREQVRSAISDFQPTVVVNFAAESHVDNSYRQASSFTRTNIDGVVTLLEAVRDHAPEALFVQISTDEVYGDDIHWHYPSSKLNPLNPYAATKAAAEFMVKSYARSFGIRYMITRSSNNWGPRQHPEKFIPAAVRAKVTGREMVVHGYDLRRDWLHVYDNARAIRELIDKAGSGTWNIATGTQHTLAEVLDRIGDVPHSLSPERPGVDLGYWVGADATWRHLGWRPRDFMTDDRWEEYVAGATERFKALRGLR